MAARVAAVGGTYVANTALKLVVRRRRPQLPGLPPLTETPTQLSFPSAHAATSFAGARLYSRMGLASGPLYGLAAVLAALAPVPRGSLPLRCARGGAARDRGRGGRVVSGRVIGGRVVSGRVIGGRVVSGRVIGGLVVDGRALNGRVANGGTAIVAHCS